MPTYYVEFQTGAGTELLDALELPDVETMRREAIRGVREIVCEGLMEGEDRTHWIAHIRDDHGRLLFSLHFADLLASPAKTSGATDDCRAGR